jgi:hypothetical protein
MIHALLEKKIPGIRIFWIKSEHLQGKPEHTVRYKVDGDDELKTIMVSDKELCGNKEPV